MAWTLAELADSVGGKVHGDDTVTVDSVATITNATSGQITFLTNPQYKHLLEHTAASAVILKEDNLADCPVNAIVVDNPHAAYARIAQTIHKAQKLEAGIHPSAIVDPGATIGEQVAIGPNTVIESGVKIGRNTRIGANAFIGQDTQIGSDCFIDVHVTIHHGVRIGDRVIIFSGAVIGSDGFGHAFDNGKWLKVPQLGGVEIGNDVEVGASTTIDRGAIEDTIIEDGVKLDNQIQIAHNVRLGAHTVIAACTGVAGSAKIGKRCMIGGLTGIAGHIELADDVAVAAMTLVSKSIKTPGTYSSALPFEPAGVWRRYVARFKQLDNYVKRLKRLEDLNNKSEK